jgi:hypothetical protein
MRHEKQVFTNRTLELDNNDFIDCRFYNCTLVFRGKNIPQLGGSFIGAGTTFHFKGAAENTVNFLNILYQHGMEAPVESFFENIPQNFPNEPRKEISLKPQFVH